MQFLRLTDRHHSLHCISALITVHE